MFSKWTILLGLGLAAATVDASDWPQRRGLANDGTTSETSWGHGWPVEGPEVAWKADVGVGFSSVVVAGGRAFTAGNANDQDTVFCLDASTGREAWKFTFSEPLNPKMYEGGPNTTPTVSLPSGNASTADENRGPRRANVGCGNRQ